MRPSDLLGFGSHALGSRQGGTLGDESNHRDGGASEPKLGTTIVLLAQIRAGNQAARTKLWNRYLQPLRRLVRGHFIPRHVRALHDVDDIVMRVIEQVDPRLSDFDYRREGALLEYLRKVTRNLIISLGRVREPEREEISSGLVAGGASPEDDAVASERRRAFESALAILDDRQREAVVMRLEYGFTYQEIAEAVEAPTANAARMMIKRAIVKMIEHMRDHRDFD
jgi:RNA polymerase sigma-70 factor (ECF subfamily)